MTVVDAKKELTAAEVETLRDECLLGIDRLEVAGELSTVLDILNFSAQVAVSMHGRGRS